MDNFSLLEELVNENLSEISEGENEYTIKAIKNNLSAFLLKKTEKQKKGLIAELFAHLFLREIGFRQEFIFNDLEEKSLKKGLMGYIKTKTCFG